MSDFSIKDACQKIYDRAPFSIEFTGDLIARPKIILHAPLILPILLLTLAFTFDVSGQSMTEGESKKENRSIAKGESSSSELRVKDTDEERSEEKSLTELQKRIREISKQTNVRRRMLYKENEEINALQKKISELHQRVNEIISTDKEYSKLLGEQKSLREEMKKYYDRKRKFQRSIGGRALKKSNNGSPSPVVPALPVNHTDPPSTGAK